MSAIPTDIHELRDILELRRRLPAPARRREIRLGAGVAASAVARVCGVTRQAVWAWESGSAEPSDGRLTAYVEVLEMLEEASGAQR